MSAARNPMSVASVGRRKWDEPASNYSALFRLCAGLLRRRFQNNLRRNGFATNERVQEPSRESKQRK